MKWPSQLMLIRHDTSEYNVLRDRKKNDPEYRHFVELFESDPGSTATIKLARSIQQRFALGKGDAETNLADLEGRQAFETGVALREGGSALPHVIFVSPYHRAKETLRHITRGWPELDEVPVYEEERIREQEHGLSLLYNDWRVFETLHPEQQKLRKLEGAYWYRYPQGENVPDVRERNRSWMRTLTRDWNGQRVLAVTHHLNILAFRANMERWSAERFMHTDEHDKPINCGVTTYVGKPELGKDGRLVLGIYNECLYQPAPAEV
jgi:broad specificity phosphatase PhoE